MQKKPLSTLFAFIAMNFILSLLIASQYIFSIGGEIPVSSYLFLLASTISTMLIFYIVFFLISSVFLFIKSRKIFYLFHLPFFTLVQILLISDIGIFKVFKFHINGVIINFLTTPNSWDSVYLGTSTYITAIGIIAFIIAFEFFALHKILKKDVSKPYFTHVKTVLTILVLFVFIDKFTYAYADLFNKTNVIRYTKVLPVYLPLTAKSLGRKLGIEINREKNLKYNAKFSTLNYPTQKIEIKKPQKDFNILWIVDDAFRKDMFTPEITPNLAKLAEKSQVFENHYSGGNATRFGMFSMFYGIYSYNWHQFLAERRSPVFLKALKDMGYNFFIYSSTSLTFPEFRKTAFLDVIPDIKDNFKGENSWQKDRAQVDYFKANIKEIAKKRFFGLLFFDSSHSHDYPKKYEKFKTASKETNFLLMSHNEAKNAKLNYINSLYYEDDLLKEVLDALKKQGVLDKTIIVVTGDHGEEFYENGNYGHNSSFSHYQTIVPLVMYVPFMKPKKYKKMTSHLDIVPTFFDLLGIHQDPATYSNGVSMFDDKHKRDYTVICSWSQCAYDDKKDILVFSMESHSAGVFDLRDTNYTIQENGNLSTIMPKMQKIMKDFGRFFK